MNLEDKQALAHQFMINAVKTKAGQNIWVEYIGPKAKELAEVCAETVKGAGAVPHLVDSSSDFMNDVIGNMSSEEVEQWGIDSLSKMQKMQGYIRVCDDADEDKIKISDERKAEYKKARRVFTDYRVNNTNWLVVSTPTEEFAKACGMEFSVFEEFYKKACLTNYKAMEEATLPLKKIMDEGKNVRIYSPTQETDLTLSIDGMKSIPCVGDNNIPDGECYTAPVKTSVNGKIKFSMSNYDGQRFEFIKLEIKDGKIIKAEAENAERTKALNKILDMDEGSRYFGEFAINFNPFIDNPTGDILFDEKINGGIHLAAGACYDEAPNGNESANHWDMVHIQRPEYGGGEIWIDDKLIRKDGIFVVPELEALNPEELKKASTTLIKPKL